MIGHSRKDEYSAQNAWPWSDMLKRGCPLTAVYEWAEVEKIVFPLGTCCYDDITQTYSIAESDILSP